MNLLALYESLFLSIHILFYIYRLGFIPLCVSLAWSNLQSKLTLGWWDTKRSTSNLVGSEQSLTTPHNDLDLEEHHVTNLMSAEVSIAISGISPYSGSRYLNP